MEKKFKLYCAEDGDWNYCTSYIGEYDSLEECKERLDTEISYDKKENSYRSWNRHSYEYEIRTYDESGEEITVYERTLGGM